MKLTRTALSIQKRWFFLFRGIEKAVFLLTLFKGRPKWDTRPKEFIYFLGRPRRRTSVFAIPSSYEILLYDYRMKSMVSTNMIVKCISINSPKHVHITENIITFPHLYLHTLYKDFFSNIHTSKIKGGVDLDLFLFERRFVLERSLTRPGDPHIHRLFGNTTFFCCHHKPIRHRGNKFRQWTGRRSRLGLWEKRKSRSQAMVQRLELRWASSTPRRIRLLEVHDHAKGDSCED